jgi:hypothetical protein
MRYAPVLPVPIKVGKRRGGERNEKTGRRGEGATSAAAVFCWQEHTVFGAGKDITTGQGHRNALLLDGAWAFKAFLKNAHQQFALEMVILKLVALGRRDVLCACNQKNQLSSNRTKKPANARAAKAKPPCGGRRKAGGGRDKGNGKANG